jgi:DNA-binding MarR family transcriptional regulator
MTEESANREKIEGILKQAEQVFRELLPTVPRELLELHITMPQLKSILLLFLNGPTRMSALAADLGVTLATATGLVDRLVERGIVVRESQPDDRRVVLCRLSETGQNMVSRVWDSSRQRSREILEYLDTGTLQMLSETLNAMLEFARTQRK